MLLGCLLGSLLLAGCGQSEATFLGGLPTPPADAVEIPPDVLPFDQAEIVESFKTSINASMVDMRIYLIPLETEFSSLETHYQRYLGEGWSAKETPAVTAARAEGRDAAIWGSTQGEILSIQYVQAPGYDGNLLIVFYAKA